MIRRCVHGKEALDILEACHNGPSRGTSRCKSHRQKGFDAGIFWASITKMQQRVWLKIVTDPTTRKNSQRDEVFLKIHPSSEIFDFGLEFMDPSLCFKMQQIILVLPVPSSVTRTHFANDNFAKVMLIWESLISSLHRVSPPNKWTGPFTIVQVFPYGTVELSENSGPNFKVNGHRLKHYFGGDNPANGYP
ncbi:hypothetical protein Tco_0876026 [Tanacetum coccineum]|uniref:Uncharacterized protein n=1 Tax=Tanacetum coccineum TaxID=301880 RepID=A0ABQ5BR40_9ASTR